MTKLECNVCPPLLLRTTLNRALAERIFLLLRKRDENGEAQQWTFLQGPIEKSDKTLRSCAERVAKVKERVSVKFSGSS